LQTDKEITAKQAALVEEFIEQKMNQPFDLVFIVSRVTRVTSKAAPSFDLINPEPQFYFTPLNKFPAFPTMPEQYTPNQFQVGK
jgi:transcriptional regulator of nitric oxide reductase